ncbi:MAG: hypothetical protein AAFV80_24030, partial [Bacteroidota bacterium]
HPEGITKRSTDPDELFEFIDEHDYPLTHLRLRSSKNFPHDIGILLEYKQTKKSQATLQVKLTTHWEPKLEKAVRLINKHLRPTRKQADLPEQYQKSTLSKTLDLDLLLTQLGIWSKAYLREKDWQVSVKSLTGKSMGNFPHHSDRLEQLFKKKKKQIGSIRVKHSKVINLVFNVFIWLQQKPPVVSIHCASKYKKDQKLIEAMKMFFKP